MDSWTFIVPGRPVGNEAKTSATVRKGRSTIRVHYTPEKTRNFYALVVMCAKAANLPMLDQVILDVAICIPCRVKKYKTMPDKWIEPRVRPDRDNIIKIIGDALQNILYLNDKDVLDGRTYYRFIPPDAQPYTEVTVRATGWIEHISLPEGYKYNGEWGT